MDSIGREVSPSRYLQWSSMIQRTLQRSALVSAGLALVMLLVSMAQGASSGAILLAAVLLVAGNHAATVKASDHVQSAALFGFISTVCAVLIYYQLDSSRESRFLVGCYFSMANRVAVCRSPHFNKNTIAFW